MEPILSVITTAIVTAATNLGKKFVSAAAKDAYAGLKRLIMDRFGKNTEVESALVAIEKQPDMASCKTGLEKALEKAGVNGDDIIVDEARHLLNILVKDGVISKGNYSVQLTGSGAVSQGAGAISAGAGGAAVSGDVHGGISIGGGKNPSGEDGNK